MPDLGDPATRIETQEAAIRRLEWLCDRIAKLKNTMAVAVPGNEDATKKIKRKAEQHWLMTYGQAIGTLAAFRQCKLVGRNTYRVFHRKILEVFMGEDTTAKDAALIGTALLSKDELIRYIAGLCDTVIRYRDQCDVYLPDDPETTARLQVEAYRKWNIYYGQALGTLIAYRQANQVEDFAYGLLKAKVQATLAPRVVGTVQAPIQQPGGVRLV